MSYCNGFQRSQDEYTRYCWQEEALTLTIPHKLEIIRRLKGGKG